MFQEILHHQNLGSELGHHPVLHLSNPCLLAIQAKLLKPQELQNLVKLFQLLIQLQTQIRLQDRYPLGHGSRTMGMAMEVYV